MTVDGPLGPVDNALIVVELHQDGTTEKKIFARGYGEFLTGSDEDVEALVFAIPIDAIDIAPPASFTDLASQSLELIDIVETNDQASTATAAIAIATSWAMATAETIPSRIVENMETALTAFDTASEAGDSEAARQAAIDIARSALDLLLRYQSPTTTDLARFSLALSQLELDLSARNLPGVLDDVTRLEWIRDRVLHALDADDAGEFNVALASLRERISIGDFDTWDDPIAVLREIASDVEETDGEEDA